MDTEQRTYELQLAATDAGLDQLTPISVTADEAMSRPYRVVLQARTMVAGDPTAFKPSTWLRKKLGIGLARDGSPTWFHGIVVAVEHVGTDHVQHQIFSIEIAPAFSLLRLTRRTRVFSDQKPVDVIKAVLSEGSIAIDLKATGAGGVMRHITQFEESDFAFVSRLLEQEGAAYWFTHSKSAHTMVIGDSVNHHPAKDAAIHAGFVTSSKLAVNGEGVVTSLSQRFEVAIKDAAVRHYSEGHPKQAALGQKSAAAQPAHGGKYNEADYHVAMTDADATAYATRVADSLTAGSSTLIGGSGILAYRAGARAAVIGKEGYEEHMLLTQVQHNFIDDIYGNTFQAIPVGRLPWRPARTTPIPRIDGLVPAMVTAAAGDQGQGNDGSYRVRLLNSDDTNDRIARMAQPNTGPAQGIHFPLPVNTEVMLGHAYGHPDRPIIAGAMHNAEDASQVTESNKSQSVIRTPSNHSLVFEDAKDSEWLKLTSKSGNQMSFEDGSGSELVLLNAVKDHKVEIANNEDRHVGANLTESVDGSVTTKIGKDLTASVKGNTTVSTDGNYSGTVSGTMDLEVTKAAKANFDNTLTIDATKDIKVTGKAQIMLAATKSLVIDTDDAFSLGVAKKSTWKSDGISIDSKGDIIIKAGEASITMKKSGEIIIKGSKVKIEGSGDVVIKGSKTAVN